MQQNYWLNKLKTVHRVLGRVCNAAKAFFWETVMSQKAAVETEREEDPWSASLRRRRTGRRRRRYGDLLVSINLHHGAWQCWNQGFGMATKPPLNGSTGLWDRPSTGITGKTGQGHAYGLAFYLLKPHLQTAALAWLPHWCISSVKSKIG